MTKAALAFLVVLHRRLHVCISLCHRGTSAFCRPFCRVVKGKVFCFICAQRRPVGAPPPLDEGLRPHAQVGTCTEAKCLGVIVRGRDFFRNWRCTASLAAPRPARVVLLSGRLFCVVREFAFLDFLFYLVKGVLEELTLIKLFPAPIERTVPLFCSLH